jgi:hypothetical protein
MPHRMALVKIRLAFVNGTCEAAASRMRKERPTRIQWPCNGMIHPYARVLQIVVVAAAAAS